MGAVLVMTDHDDHTSDLIVAAIARRGVQVVRLDPGAGPLWADVHLAPSGRWTGVVGDEHRAVRLEEVGSVLWRWPGRPAGHPAIADPAARAWAAREDDLGILGVIKTLPVRWVNHPDRVAAAGKPHQLTTAAACGLVVPPTLITTRGQAARSWAAGRDVLYKAFHAQGADEDAMVTAGRVDAAALPGELGAASLFQEIVPGVPVRLTVIGPHMFAVEITGSRHLDWRPEQDKLTFTPVDVPEHVERGVRRFLGAYGLEYGAFDFIRDPDGRWVFLEINPSGMYGFVELQSGLPITAAFADHLCESVDRTRP